ncbi:LytR/AlgR family response regulator transcription factor [Aureivirga sp. CE67]|uniref:LytR/AlgR family response regulator transcription factor n=1 Tax=Aureivirga sp. CE67 TaxID=1788983 RepID=UPI0018CAFFF7|nr:LytTR family DNA-binding domain-containing protein [Aureivirga sp. CE67]
MIKSLIVEDEKHAVLRLKKLIENYFSDRISIVAVTDSITEAEVLIKEMKPDLVFLDVQLKDGIGFDLLDKIEDKMSFEVIFTTGLRNYKEKALDYFAFYYLNKPLDEEKFKLVIENYLYKKTAFDLEKYLSFKHQIESKNVISLPVNGGYEIQKINDILYCEADGSYTNFHLADGKSHMSSTNLKKNEEILKEHLFYRIHRSTLVNLKHIKSYNATSGKIVLTNKKTLLVSARNKKSFSQLLKLMVHTIN